MYNIKVLSKEDIMKVSDMKEVIKQVEAVYCAKSNQETEVWPTVFYDFETGVADLDIKSGYLKNMNLFGHKTVSFFAHNEEKGLPTLNGTIVIYDSTTGVPLGVMDGAYITGMRTGAAGAIGAKYLARKNSKNLLILGAGNQAIFQIAAMLSTFDTIEKVSIADTYDLEKAFNFKLDVKYRLKEEFNIDAENIEFEVVTDLEATVKMADIIITVTPSRKPIIQAEWVKAGTHFSCIGADMKGKVEIDPAIVEYAKVYCDDKKHCMEVGEIELALKRRYIFEENIMGEIGDVILGKVEGRSENAEITVFDATGMALLDIATAKTVLDLAIQHELGTNANL